MISTRHRFIFIHVPKTGGNTIQSRLLPISDDEKQIRNSHQDGVERFEVGGPITAFKHMPLSEYAKALGDALADYRVITTLRSPFERLVSFYFSPHRWHNRTPVWDLKQFLDLVVEVPSTADHLRLGKSVHRPDITLRFDHLVEDFKSMANTLELPVDTSNMPVLNTSSDRNDLRSSILADVELRAVVEERYADDMALLEQASKPD